MNDAGCSQTRSGWSAGGGIEWGFARNWAARIEYLHLDLSNQTFSSHPPNNVFRSIDEGRLQADTVRVDVNYLFNRETPGSSEGFMPRLPA